MEDWSTIIIGEGGCDKWVQEFDEAKAIHFGTPEERMLPDWKDGRRTAKAKAFRYCIFADKYDGSTSTGLAELPGNDFMVTISKERMIAKYFKSFVDDRWDDAVAGTFMHELGHTLGLYHGGEQDSACGLEDRYNYKPNYHSVMNYSWQFPVPTYADSWVLDFSRAEWDDLDENNLTENDGIGGHEGHFVPYGPPSSSELSPENGPVNWNHVIGNQQVGVVADINYVNSAQSPSPGDLLWGQEDWSKLRFQMTDASSFEDGVHLGTTFGDEMTDEILAELGEIGRVDLMDFAEFQNCFTPNGGGRSLACDSLDFRGDGSIDLSDFFEFRRRWW